MPKAPPNLRPKKKRKEQRVFLMQEDWDALTEIAAFHNDAFKEMDADEKISRNDIIEVALKWFCDGYWDDKGGKPTNAKDRAEKVKRLAETLMSER